MAVCASQMCIRDRATGRPSYTRYKPDSPEGAREIYIPNEINGVKITPEEQKELREGDVYKRQPLIPRWKTTFPHSWMPGNLERKISSRAR